MSELKYLAVPSVDEKIIIAREKRPIANSGRSVKTCDFVESVIPSFELPYSCFTGVRLTFNPFSIKYVDARTDDQHHSNSYIE